MASASSAPTTVLAQQARLGQFPSSAVPVPTTNPGTGQPYGGIIVSGTLSTTDAQVASNTCRITVYASWDNGLTYAAQGPVYNWTGGIGPKGDYTLPEESFGIPMNAGGQQPTHMYATLDTLGNTLNTGLTIAFQ